MGSVLEARRAGKYPANEPADPMTSPTPASVMVLVTTRPST